MQNNTQELVSSTFLTVVEQLTFMFGEPTDKAELDLDGCALTQASMSFEGDLVGSLAVAVPNEIMADIAANILGLEPEEIEPTTMMPDALAEMLNVVCGHVIMALAGNDANFKLHAPHLEEIDAGRLPELIANEAYIGFQLDDSPVLLGLNLET